MVLVHRKILTHFTVYRETDELLLSLRLLSKSQGGQTPFHVAAWNGHGACMQVLIEKCDNVKAADPVSILALCDDSVSVSAVEVCI